MAKIIAFVNQKGGVGKTTTTINIGRYLADFGKKVLLVDLDPQGNASSGLGVDARSREKNLYHAMVLGLDPKELIVTTPAQGLHLIPAAQDLAGAEIEMVHLEGREFRLYYVLRQLRPYYDYILIDSPPSLGLLTVNGLVASDEVIIPVQTEYYALEGLSQLVKTINLVKDNLNPNLEIEGIVMTMADFRTNLTQEVINEVKKHFADKVYKTVIPRNIRLSEAPGFGKPIFLYDKESEGAKKYLELTREFLIINTSSSPVTA